ncbi:MAG: translation initiation factor IF-3 [Ancrocorticia sp.]
MSHVEEFRGAAINNEPRVNERIHVDQVRLVGPGGEQVGVVRVEDALRLAQESGLDLVEVAPNSNPPVAKLMDYGKFKYESAQKAREARRNQSNTVIKSIRIGLKIDGNDYQTKKGQAERFLNGGDKVKFDLRFKGREQSRPEQGVRLLRGLAEELSEISTIEAAPRAEGRNMSMVLAPLRKKSEAKSDQRRRREAEREERRAREAERAQRAREEAAAAKAQAPAPVAQAAAAVAASPAPAPVPAQSTPVAAPVKPAAPAVPAAPTPRATPKPGVPRPPKA